ncbi:substrate-binding periplasmic protein [Aliiglaciecola sp. M165]|uniref:substrate-binding periplasmic protein n=1 Tax=Aliiglaciecola sp. M165 TaxID=2593649 RepID=UPI0011814BFB|nr:transporter substrate-binding domain-containing protein [Aliiglaciecola sp. M165]TRY32565.1 transporter substrate-binding domain-containing protein [Aliiglaciecola sp. M165]
MSVQRTNPMIMVGLIVAMILLLATIFVSSTRPETAVKKVVVATGNWPPYSGETLPHNGISGAIVDFVFTQMGYQVEYRFMPWSLAQASAETAQKNNQIRAIYPYIQTERRESLFYFSEGLIDISFGVFYDRFHNPLGIEISNYEDLKNHAVMMLDGYDFDPLISQYIPQNTCTVKDTAHAIETLVNNYPYALLSTEPITSAAITKLETNKKLSDFNIASLIPALQSVQHEVVGFSNAEVSQEVYLTLVYPNGELTANNISSEKLNIIAYETAVTSNKNSSQPVCGFESLNDALIALLYLSKPRVLLEAREVAESVLSRQLPALSARISQGQFSNAVPHKMMFSKSNPDNLALRDEFDRILRELKSNQQAYQELIIKSINAIDMSDAVALKPLNQDSTIVGWLFDVESQECELDSPQAFPLGSKASIKRWPQQFLSWQPEVELNYAVGKVLNGPLSGKSELYCFQASSITLR